jgi:PilZ domain
LSYQYQIQRIALTFQIGLAIMKYPARKMRMPETTETQYANKRRSRRAKIARPLRVRPSDPNDEHFEDIPMSINASKEGIYFHTRRSNYYKGMRLFVTFPYSSPHDPMNCEYVAEVVRVENLANGRFGVAVFLKMTMNYSASAPPGSITRA